MPKRKLENSEQRPAPLTRPQNTEMPEIAGQRLRRIGLTRGNIGDSPPPRNNNPETGLAGCPERIRTPESRDTRPATGRGLTANGWGRLALNFDRRKEWTSA